MEGMMANASPMAKHTQKELKSYVKDDSKLLSTWIIYQCF